VRNGRFVNERRTWERAPGGAEGAGLEGYTVFDERGEVVGRVTSVTERDGEVELVLAHPIGVTEVAHGRLDGAELRLRGEELAIGRAATGLDVRGLERRYRIDGDALTYEIDMATGATPMTLHLTGSLRRDT